MLGRNISQLGSYLPENTLHLRYKKTSLLMYDVRTERKHINPLRAGNELLDVKATGTYNYQFSYKV
jgi:hypothetical protein